MKKLKTILTLVLTASILITSTAVGISANGLTTDLTTSGDTTVILTYGDIDNDGKITASDALFALRYSVGLENFTNGQKVISDVDNDNKTMVQPDLFVLCREFDIQNKRIDGAPDLTVEILSDSTRSKDLLLKTYKYKNAGVREYWIIDPKRQIVLVYDFADENLEPEKYTFSDQIPVHISEGCCKIDFNKISSSLGL